MERLRAEHDDEIVIVREAFIAKASANNGYNLSKKLIDYRTVEKKTFASKDYDSAVYFKHMADDLEQQERLEHQDKLLDNLDKLELKVRKKQ